MATPVCTICYEDQGKAKATLLLESKCLDESSHEDAIKVGVYLTGDGVLEPEVRPTPKAHFKGEFVLCPKKKCKGKKCTYPHCLKEKATWNAEKFGVRLPSSSDGSAPAASARGGTTATATVSVNTVLDVSNSETKSPQQLQPGEQSLSIQTSDLPHRSPAQQLPMTPSPEPWPDFPGFGALTMGQLQRATSLASTEKTPLPVLGVEAPHQARSMEIPHQAQSMETPHQVRSTEAAHQARSKEAPHQARSKEAPHQARSMEAPRQARSMEAPRQAQSMEAPRQARSKEAPHQARSMEAPHQARSMEIPRQAQSMETPHQVRSTEAAHQARSMEAPRQAQSMEAPRQARSKEAPHQARSMEAPHQARSMEAPHQARSMEAPHQAQSMEAPHQARSMEAPHQARSKEALHQAQLTESPSTMPSIQHVSRVSGVEPPLTTPDPYFHIMPVSPPQRLQSYAAAAALPVAQRPPVPVPQSASPPAKQSPQKASTSGRPMRQKVPRRNSSTAVIYESLEVINYHLKFRELLRLEEKAHGQLLKEKCDGEHFLALLPAGQKPKELKSDAKPYHARFGYFKKMGSDEVSYATQSASDAIIEVGDNHIKCDILRENNYHADERLYVAFTKEAEKELSSYFSIGKRPFESSYPLMIQFRLKYSYFRSLKEAIRDFSKAGIVRILPKPSSFVPVQPLDDTKFEPYQKFCSPDQLEALKMIASAPASGPPILISGPFGTGKTRVLAVTAHFLQRSVKDGSPLRILVCTQQHTSADAYLDMYSNLTSEKEPITIIRLIAPNTWRKRGPMERLYKNVSDFKSEMERNSHRNRQRFLVVTTCLTAKQVVGVLPSWFFTHIFLDEGAQMREPEAIAPLCMASNNTKIVIAGDKHQVGPAMLVLGEEPQKHGLSISLLERLYDCYHALGDVAKPYCAHLHTNFRCHRKILDLARQVAYKMHLDCKVPDHSAHPRAEFPLRFVCTSLDADVGATHKSINEDEVQVALKEASRFFMEWPPHHWGKRDLSQICFLSPCRGQVTVARNARGKELPPQVKLVRKVPTYQIQGQEFRALFISTSEPTTASGETRDCTKSISDPFVFITALTRAQSLVVAVGNPFMLLKRERHMVEKYGDRGHCWSLFLKACLDNNSLSVHCPSGRENSKMKLLTERVNQSISGLNLKLLEPLECATERDETAPSINIIPDILTESSGASSSTEETMLKASPYPEFIKDHVVKEKLGQGGFGVVYCVQHRLDKRKYALKIVRLPEKHDEQEKVVREVQAHAQLNHVNIVQYCNSWKQKAPDDWKHKKPWRDLLSCESVSYPRSDRQTECTETETEALEASATTSPNVSSQSSHSASEGASSFSVVFEESSEKRLLKRAPEPPICLCIKTELCDKATLKTWLSEHKYGRKRKYITECFMEILEAVKYIHSKGLMHRDIKPSNIFFSLAETESETKIKIGDFGLVTTSHVAVSEAVAPHSKYLGTSFYISPEQNRKGSYNEKVDVYALGVVYFEMNCPFGTEMERSQVLTTLCNRGKFPNKFEDNLPHEAGIIERMLTEAPERRPAAKDVVPSTVLKNLKKSFKRTDVIPRL